MLPDWLEGKKIGIFGFGVNNSKLTEWLLRHGATDLVVYDDSKQSEERGEQARAILPADRVIVGDGALDKAADREVIFRSAGIHPGHPALEAVRSHGARITSQTDLFLELCPAKTVGITGTKGKGTTALLLAHLLQTGHPNEILPNPPLGKEGTPLFSKEGLGEISLSNVKVIRQPAESNVYLAGNIGKDPFEFLDELTADDIVVLELSSGQLQDVTHSPNLAIVLDVTEDHLDYHASFDEYLDAKKPIVRYQQPGDIALLNLDSSTAMSFGLETQATVLYYSTTKSVDAGGYLDGETVRFRDPRQFEDAQVSIRDFPLPGPHHRVNVTAAVTAALILGQDPGATEAKLGTFSAGPHRMELVAELNGVKWVNDSYGTLPIASAAAIRSFPAQPVIVIVGGRTKGLSWQPLAEAMHEIPLKRVLSIGETGPEITQAAVAAGMDPALVERVETLDRAVAYAAEIADPGDVVLLAPASTSFDQFRNATERGEIFKRLVREIHPKTESSVQ